MRDAILSPAMHGWKRLLWLSQPAPQIRPVPCAIAAAHVPLLALVPFINLGIEQEASSRVTESRHQKHRMEAICLYQAEFVFFPTEKTSRGEEPSVQRINHHNTASWRGSGQLSEVSPRATLIFKQHTSANHRDTWRCDSQSSSVLQVRAQYCNRTEHCTSDSGACKWGFVATAYALH